MVFSWARNQFVKDRVLSKNHVYNGLRTTTPEIRLFKKEKDSYVVKIRLVSIRDGSIL